MTPGYYRELLETKPALLAEMIAFNRRQSTGAETPAGLSAHALQKYPALRQRWEAAAKKKTPAQGIWSFANESERLALLPDETLVGLAKMLAAAVYADAISKTVKRDEVTAVRETLGADICRWALVRGRFEAGSLAAALREGRPAGTTLSEALESLAGGALGALREGWSQALRDETAARFDAMPLRTSSPLTLTPDVRRRVWFFVRKLILRELDKKWTPFFE